MDGSRDGGTAFPTTRYEEVDLTVGCKTTREVQYPGISVWDFYAAHALTRPGMIALDAGRLADEMLAERLKRME